MQLFTATVIVQQCMYVLTQYHTRAHYNSTGKDDLKLQLAGSFKLRSTDVKTSTLPVVS